MNYNLEAYVPDRFQELCQALLTIEYPGIQCFPVGMGDGGRDASQALDGKRDAIIFQVKSSRNPSREDDPVAWLERAIGAELETINSLILRGAKRYILMTNVPGTAIQDRGTIDRLNAILTSKISIPSQCMWRGDIERRIDSNRGIRGAFSDLMTAADVLLSILNSDLTEHRDRRERAVTAFLAEQFREDQLVKFRQAELENRLLRLFVDVPLTLATNWSNRGSTEEMREEYASFLKIVQRQGLPNRDLRMITVFGASGAYEIYDHDLFAATMVGPIGAASFFLDSEAGSEFPCAVLEGSPGQGKSTLSQYLCQVHRARLLSKVVELSELPLEHQISPVRIPFRIELRHLAAWLVPDQEEGDEDPESGDLRTLETYLADLIFKKSGGLGFDVSDLLSVFSNSPILLVLDGLDEVPAAASRQRIVEQVSSGVDRIKANAADVQVLITSRPSVFDNSPGFARTSYTHFHLTALARPHIDLYADKWMTARGLTDSDRAMVESILDEKLSQPHMTELARNPMQLAILLHLINAKGSALPDRRTELYDSYIEMLFAREADKDTTVRDNLKLLKDIHGHLAWMLHGEAELGDGNGRISEADLTETVRRYLEAEGHSTRIVDLLFDGVVDRVCALVKRTEGLYEFEVQPLREYFCARYLYDTAQYSPAGQNKPGTLPERFEGIVRNPYWLNVTRFFAGCFSKGELASLFDSLAELTSDESLKYTAQPRMISSLLLGDWVFASSPKVSDRVVGLLLEGFGTRHTLDVSDHFGGSISLPLECGGAQLGARAIELLRSDVHIDRRSALRTVASESLPPEDLYSAWREYAPRIADRSRALFDGLIFGLLGKVEVADLTELIKGSDHDADGIPYRLVVATAGNRDDVLEQSSEWRGMLKQRLLNVPQLWSSRWLKTDSEIGRLGGFVSRMWTLPVLSTVHQDGRRLIDQFGVMGIGANENKEPPILRSHPGDSSRLTKFLAVSNAQLERPLQHWVATLDPWREITSSGISLLGQAWIWDHLAVLGAGIRNSDERAGDCKDLFDEDYPLSDRVRYARLRSGSAKWWLSTIERATTDREMELSAAVILSYGSIATLAHVMPALSSNLDYLGERNLCRLLRSVQDVRRVWQLREDTPTRFKAVSSVGKVRDRTSLALSCRSNKRLVRDLLSGRDFDSSAINRQALKLSLAAETPANAEDWTMVLAKIRKLRDARGEWRLARYPGWQIMPHEIAKSVIDDAEHYPPTLIELAELSCRNTYRPKAVIKLATSDRWFEA